MAFQVAQMRSQQPFGSVEERLVSRQRTIFVTVGETVLPSISEIVLKIIFQVGLKVWQHAKWMMVSLLLPQALQRLLGVLEGLYLWK